MNESIIGAKNPFLYADERLTHNPISEKAAEFKYANLTKSETDAISKLPYVSATSTRYMTAGVSEDLLRCADGNMLITEGRMLTSKDNAHESKVCVMNQTFMSQNSLEVGDRIMLKLGDKLFEQNSALGAAAVVRERYADAFTDEIEFEIVGAYVDVDAARERDNTPHWSYSEFTVFVPLSFLPCEVPGKADNMLRMLALLDGLYPIALAVAVVMAGLFPGLIVMQSDREAAIMRVLGTTKKRSRAMLLLEQIALCLAGLVCAAALLAAVNSSVVADYAQPLGAYTVIHLVACIAGALICSITITRRSPIKLLQVKE